MPVLVLGLALVPVLLGVLGHAFVLVFVLAFVLVLVLLLVLVLVPVPIQHLPRSTLAAQIAPWWTGDRRVGRSRRKRSRDFCYTCLSH